MYEGDTAEKLAREFCEQNGLVDMEDKLRIMLDRQIANVLPKINEEEGLNESQTSQTNEEGK